jgi:hypothetical protein
MGLNFEKVDVNLVQQLEMSLFFWILKEKKMRLFFSGMKFEPIDDTNGIFNHNEQ